MQEIGVYELGCRVRVDEFGFFIHWKSDGKVGTACFCCSGVLMVVCRSE